MIVAVTDSLQTKCFKNIVGKHEIENEQSWGEGVRGRQCLEGLESQAATRYLSTCRTCTLCSTWVRLCIGAQLAVGAGSHTPDRLCRGKGRAWVPAVVEMWMHPDCAAPWTPQPVRRWVQSMLHKPQEERQRAGV